MTTAQELRQAVLAVAAVVNDPEALGEALRVLAAATKTGGPKPAAQPAPERFDLRRGSPRHKPKSVAVAPDLLIQISAALRLRSQSDVAEEIGVTKGTLLRIVETRRASPDSDRLIDRWAKRQAKPARSVGFMELAEAIKAAAIRKIGRIDAPSIARASGASVEAVTSLLGGGDIDETAEAALLDWSTS
jgi:hypothetical protein